MDVRNIGEKIIVLLEENTRDSEKEVGLKSKGEWVFRLDNGVASFGQVDLKDLFLVNLL